MAGSHSLSYIRRWRHHGSHRAAEAAIAGNIVAVIGFLFSVGLAALGILGALSTSGI